jgi:prolyl oligopeptidase
VLSYDPAASATTDTGLVTPSSVDFSQMEAEEVFATSYEGTRVPLSILHKKGLTLDGSHPTILTGYGAYGLSLEPGFSPTALAWLERGNVLAIAHVRGGGEYGEAWHLAGEKLTKLNTVFDFIACAEYLINQQYTAPKYLAGRGGSAGGMTVGGALTWRPDLFSVILDQVGVSDTLRVELTPNGPPNISELGSVQNEEGFHGLYAMGAYFHVRDGTAYPAVLFTTGANDPRVAPWQMTKMTARVQAATRSDRPVLLRVDYDAGHGMGSTKSQNEMLTADLWSFALWQMGDPAFQPNSQ